MWCLYIGYEGLCSAFTSGYEGICGAFTSVMRGCVVPLHRL